jgi:hypothetical protein
VITGQLPQMLTTTVPDFLTFLANTAIIGVIALVVWFLIVGSIVWLGGQVVEKFRQRLGSTEPRAETAPESGLASVEAVAPSRPPTRAASPATH